MKTGDVIEGRFQLGAIIGRGGMGVVYRAKDLVTDDFIALKSLRITNANAAKRFLREAEVLAGLTHPGVVRYLKHGQSQDGELYLAMEWLNGEDLSKRLHCGALSLPESLSLMRTLGEILSVAHRQQIIHRDIKPQNIFLCEDKAQGVKLLDFGLARLGGSFSDVTATGAVMGTPGYLAPEQATKGAKGLDASADIFSLGCVFYECLSGAMPFVGENVMAVLSKILLADAPRVREHRPEIPESVERLILEMLEKEPASRPSDGAAFLQRLDSLSMVEQTMVDIPRPRAITGGEQRLLCVLLLGRADSLAAAASGQPLYDAPTTDQASFGAMGSEADLFGGKLHALIDGSGLVTFSQVGAAADLAAQAARCALSLQRKISTGIALATGRGDISRLLPVGEVIDRANALLRSSLSDGALPEDEGAVWIDENTAGLLQNQFVLTNSERGFRLHKERDLAEPSKTLLGKALPCIGRERELANLEALTQECIDDASLKVALVTAHAGIGKSRIRQEFLSNLQRRGLSFERLLCRAEPLRASSAYSLIGNALRYTAGIQDNDPIELQQKKLKARVSRSVPAQDLERVSDFLGELAGLPATSEPSELFRSARRAPQIMAAQLQKHLEEFLRAELRISPVLLLLEDLHWADPATIKILDGVMRSLAESPLFVLALARPEVQATFPELWSSHSVNVIGLSALNKKNAERLICQVLPTISSDRLQQMIEISQGNAFYLEELCRAAADGQRTLPTTVLAMTSARLEALSKEDRRLLRAASVFGEAFWAGGVHFLLGDTTKADCEARLQALQDRELITRRPESRIGGEDELAFRHALLREAAYSMLTEDDERLAHQLAAEWLADGRELDPLVLAKHFEMGGNNGQSLHYYMQAARRARGGSAHDTVALFEKVLALGAEGTARGEILSWLTEIYLIWSEFEKVMACAMEAIPLLPKESPDRYRLLMAMWGVQAQLSPEEILPEVHEVIAEPFAGGEQGAAQLLLWSNLCLHFSIAGLCHEARAMLARVIENESFAQDDLLMKGHVLFARASIAFFLDADPWAAREHFGKAAEIYTYLSEELLSYMCSFQKLSSEVLLGAFEESFNTLEGSYEHVRSFMHDASYIVRVMQLFCLRAMGRYDEAIVMADEIAPIVARLNPTVDEKLVFCIRSACLLVKGDIAGAVEFAELGMALPLPMRVIAQSVLAEAKLAQGDISGALEITRDRERHLKEYNVKEIFVFTSRASYLNVLDAAGLKSESNQKLRELISFIKERANLITDPHYRSCFLMMPEHRYLFSLARERRLLG